MASDPLADATAALRRAGARFAFLHGSHTEGRAGPRSDLDVAGWWGGEAPPPWDVDIPPGVDFLVLDNAPLELAGRVALHGRLLFDDDPPARVGWQARTRLQYLDEEGRQRALDRTSSRAWPVVDERRLRRLLQRIREDLDYLQRQSSRDRATLVHDFERLAALKYVFLTTLEGCLDVAQHLCASEGWGPPESNADAMRILGRHAVIDPGEAEFMARAVGFRNILVHRYVDVDDRHVVGFLDRLSDLTSFVTDVATWIGGQHGEEAQSQA